MLEPGATQLVPEMPTLSLGSVSVLNEEKSSGAYICEKMSLKVASAYEVNNRPSCAASLD